MSYLRIGSVLCLTVGVRIGAGCVIYEELTFVSDPNPNNVLTFDQLVHCSCVICELTLSSNSINILTQGFSDRGIYELMS